MVPKQGLNQFRINYCYFFLFDFMVFWGGGATPPKSPFLAYFKKRNDIRWAAKLVETRHQVDTIAKRFIEG